MKTFTPFYQSPCKTEQLLILLNELKNVSTIMQFENELCEAIKKISSELEELKNILSGLNNERKDRNLTFPLIESLYKTAQNEIFGTLETVRIKIEQTKNQNRFVFVPSDKKVEERLLNQAKISFEFAINYFQSRKYKLQTYHEVLIYFENLSANYEGESLGIALTIGLIEQLSLLYNLPYVVHIKNLIATTGAVEMGGSIPPLGSEIIGNKLNTVFYSNIETFVVPKADESAAVLKLKELKQIYPKRELRIIPIDSFSELIERRNIVKFEKQPKIVRTARFIKKNWTASLSLIFISLLMAFIFIRDFDSNPALLEHHGQILQVKNKSGKILWSKIHGAIPNTRMTPEIPKGYAQLIDINNDGINEVLFNVDPRDNGTNVVTTDISCWSNSGTKLWNYSFKDKMESLDEKLSTNYSQLLLGYYSNNGKKYLICSANNRESFGSAIFTLDLLTGKRVFKTFWHPGFVVEGIIKTMDGKKKLIFIGSNNQFEKIALGLINIDNLFGQINSAMHYHYKNVPLAKMDSYIIYPKTDYSLLGNMRFPA